MLGPSAALAGQLEAIRSSPQRYKGHKVPLYQDRIGAFHYVGLLVFFVAWW